MADEEHVFIMPDDQLETEEQGLQRKNEARHQTANENAEKIEHSITQTFKVNINTAVYAIGEIKQDARIRMEQDVDLVLKT